MQVVAQSSASTGAAPCMTVVGVWGSAVHTHVLHKLMCLLLHPCPPPSHPAGLEGPSDGVYRPPKLNPVAMPEDRALSNKEMRRVREAQRRAQRRCVGEGCRDCRGGALLQQGRMSTSLVACTRLQLVASGVAGVGPIAVLHPHTLEHASLHPFTCSLSCAAVPSCVSWLRSWLVHLRR